MSDELLIFGKKLFKSYKEFITPFSSYLQNENWRFTTRHSNKKDNKGVPANSDLLYYELHLSCWRHEDIEKNVDNSSVVIGKAERKCKAEIKLRQFVDTENRHFLKIVKLKLEHSHPPEASGVMKGLPKRFRNTSISYSTEAPVQNDNTISHTGDFDDAITSFDEVRIQRNVPIANDVNSIEERRKKQEIDELVSQLYSVMLAPKLSNDIYINKLNKIKIIIASSTIDKTDASSRDEISKTLNDAEIAVVDECSGLNVLTNEKKVGRPKGAILTAVGTKKVADKQPFENLSRVLKTKSILNWLRISTKTIANVLDGEYSLKVKDITHLTVNSLSDAFLEENEVNFDNLLKPYFNSEAYVVIENLMKERQEFSTYICGQCYTEIVDYRTAQCCSCLQSYHFECENLKDAPKGNWFCTKNTCNES